MAIHRNGLAAILGGAVLLGMTGMALAAPAVATGNVNVRTGPSTGYGVVDLLYRGEVVDVQGCRGGWCYVEKQGPDGWVSASFLDGIRRPSAPAFNFEFNFGEPPRPPRPHYPSYPSGNWHNNGGWNNNGGHNNGGWNNQPRPEPRGEPDNGPAFIDPNDNG